MLLLAVGGLLFAAFANARANLAARGISTSFDFLDQTAGFGLNQSFVPYSPLSSYGRALLVGLANTLVVSLLAGVFATIIGFAAGFARLSRNWALARLAGLYVETVRNIPLLLQLLFWYVAILSPLPGPAELLHFAGVLLNNRGLVLPGPVFVPGACLGRGLLPKPGSFWRFSGGVLRGKSAARRSGRPRSCCSPSRP